MLKDDTIYLEHIHDSLLRIEEYLLNVTEDTFNRNLLLQDGITRQFEIVGEAAKRVSIDFKKQHADILWKLMTDMRNKLIHDYFDVRTDILWETAKSDVPPLLEQIKSLLNFK